MIISIQLKNFYSLRDSAVLDFTADMSSRKNKDLLAENLIDFSGDKFVNIIGLFGGNAAGKSNIIKAVDFCRNLILTSHLNNEGDSFDYQPFKFEENRPSEFYINFVTDGVEYEYSFKLLGGRVISESLYHYPNKRKSKVFIREKTHSYTHRKGAIQRPTEIESNTGPKTLFLSRASSMNRPIAQTVYRFFLEEMIIGVGNFNISELSVNDFNANKKILLKALEVSDSDIVDLRLIENNPGQLQLRSFHKENPLIAFDFEKEESEGTKRLLFILLAMLKQATTGATLFLDEFDIKLHLRLAEFLLDVIRASKGAQLVFTSHNTALINNHNLRNEQIVFVNKQNNGNSEFIPLSDYEGLGRHLDAQKAYLQGRFDSIPYTGDIYPVLAELLNQQR